jgi:hypothetical protein
VVRDNVSVVDLEGNVVALGTNEVPRAGGGIYGSPEWTEPTQLGRLSYLELEARLAGSES